MFGELIEPVDHLGILATFLDQALQLIAASTSTPVTGHPYGIELAD
jgi:hypothetical protein